MSTGKTLAVVKPGFFQYTDKIASTINSSGLKVKSICLSPWASEETIDKQYNFSDEDLIKIGENNLRICENNNLNPLPYLLSKNPLEVGKLVIKRHKDYMRSGGIAVIFIEGINAKTKLKELAGNTEPISAAPGTIRWEFSGKYDNPLIINSYLKAILSQTTLHNVVHVPDPKDADKDIETWRRNGFFTATNLPIEELDLYLHS